MSRRRHYAAAMLTGLVVLLASPVAFANADENAADNQTNADGQHISQDHR